MFFVNSKMDVPSVQHVFDKSKPKDSLRDLITFLFPDHGSDVEGLKITELDQGTTNGLLKVSSEGNGIVSTALIKVYGDGTETTIDREKEIRFHDILSHHGFAPPLIVRFLNGHAYGFVPGRVCSATDIADERVWRGVARELAHWHAVLPVVDMDNLNESILEHQPNVWSTAKRWLEALPEDTVQHKAQKELLKSEFLDLVGRLQPEDPNSSPLVFGHGDLLCGNIILQGPVEGAAQDEVETAKFIDYEHSTYCSREFDLANHFAEWAGFECNYNLLPATSTRREFIREYLQAYQSFAAGQEHNGQDRASYPPEKLEDDVRELMSQVDVYRGFPGFYWGLCALIQAQAATGSIDFDYAGYAELRFAEYRAWREQETFGKQRGGEDMSLREMKWAAK
ncbi:hypothetical protein TWF281_009913 [Arthrobotrys megalospora]